MQISDAQILQMLRNKATRESGFRALMKQYGESLYWHIRRIVVGHEDAEDAFQEASIKIFSKIDSFNGDETQLKAWVYRIATNESLTLLRKKTTFFQSIDSLGSTLSNTLTAENQGGEDKAEMLLQKAVLTLTTMQRLVFNMRYFDDMDYKDIAEVTGKNIGTLKTNYHYATDKIKEYLKENTL